MTLRLRFLDRDMMRRLGRLQIAARGLAEGFWAGVHASAYLGASVEFADHRSYVPGDEPRRIDWKVYGKRDRYFVKQYREETNLVVTLLVDGSASMTFGSGGASKLEYACMLAEAMSLVVLRQNDAVCCGVFDREAVSVGEAGRGLSYLDQLLEVVDRIQPTGGTDVSRSLRQFAERLPRRGIAVVLSDFLDEAGGVIEGVKVLKQAGHEVIAVQVLDPRELDFDLSGAVRFEGLESSVVLRIEPRRVRRAYLDELGKHVRRLREGLSRAGIEYRLTDTRWPIDALLRGLLAARHRHRRTAR